MTLRRVALLTLLLPALAACDKLGIETPAQVQSRQEAEARAIGGACRHAGRAIEDCYVLNPSASRAAVFSGWRDMDDYMRANDIAAVVPQVAPNTPPVKKKRKGEDGAGGTGVDSGAAGGLTGSKAVPTGSDGAGARGADKVMGLTGDGRGDGRTQVQGGRGS